MIKKVKKGDNVLVIAGKDKGTTSKIIEVNPKTDKVIVENVNMVSRHQKPRSQQDKGGIIRKAAWVEVSNVQVVCPTCNKATRVMHGIVNGNKVRLCKKCKASLDKEFKKAVKKESKAAKKEVKAAATTLTAKAPAKETAKTVAKAAPKNTTAKSQTTRTANTTVRKIGGGK